MVATEEPAQNLLGRFGAAIASTLVILIGRGAWTIPLIFLAWGLRFALHRGGERVLGRLVFAVIAVALSSAYASTLAAPASWPHTFGLGGLFGDTVAGALINALPGSNGFALKLLSLVAFFALVAMMLYVTGFDRAELAWLRHALTTGSILIYDRTMDLLGRGATGAARGAMTGARAMAERRSARTAGGAGGGAGSGADPVRFAEVPPMNARGLVRRAPPRVTADEADLAPVPLGADPGWNAPATLRAEPRRFEMAPDLPKEKLGFLARMRRVVDPQPELVEPVLSDAALAADAPLEDRVRARISDAIRARAGQIPAAATAGLSPLQAAIAARRADPPVVRPRGPVPLIADTRSGSLPPEPPVTARAMAAPPRYIPPLPVATAAPSCRPRRRGRPPLRPAPGPRRSRACASMNPRRPMNCRRCRCWPTPPPCSAASCPTRRWRKTPGCWNRCWTITASRARSSRSAPARSSPCTNWNPPRA
jgi:S-DNA-T family DNA segregation ATPase FtsK/SpoIIIE